MKIKKTKEEITITKKITYRTDTGLTVLETIVNDNDSTFYVSSGKYLDALIFDLPKDYFKKGLPPFKEIQDKVVKIKSLEDLDKYLIYLIDYRSEIIFNTNKIPMTKTYSFNYIGSLTEKVPNDPYYKALIEKLKEHPFVLELSEDFVPYYNADFHNQKGIKQAKIRISQEKYEEIYNVLKEKDKKFWSVRMSEAIKMSYENNHNIYGDEISKLLKDFHNQEEIEN